MAPRRGPSHPDWERPLTQYDYPELRGRESHRAIWPLAAAATGVTLVVVLLVVIPTLLGGRGGGIAAPTSSPTATATSSLDPNASGSSNPSATVTTGAPGPSIFYATHYTVKKGDTFSGIAKKYKLQLWELQQANPQVTKPSLVKVGTVLNIPFPGQLTKATPTPVSTPTPAPAPTPTPTPAG
jgi:LysM repeat protein